jgi:arginine deiminase
LRRTAVRRCALVDNAKRDHFDFVTKMRDRGVEVVEMHNLLAETVAVPEGKKWILDNQIVPNQVGLGFLDELRSYLEGLNDRALAETLLGGLSIHDFPEAHGGAALKVGREAAGATEYLLAPLPNTLYTRDTTCWIYGGVTLNPLIGPRAMRKRFLRPRFIDSILTSRARSMCGGAIQPKITDWPRSRVAMSCRSATRRYSSA